MKKYELFPSNIYVENYKSSKLYEYCINIYNDSSRKDFGVSNRLGYQSVKNLHTDEVLKPVVEGLEALLYNNLVKDISSAKVRINAMWININPKYSFNHIHNHTESWYSGIIYIKVPEKSGKLFFTDPRVGNTSSSTMSLYSELNSGIEKIDAKEDSIIIFPSYLSHGIDPNLDDKHLIVVAFNCELYYEI
jgi:uncharacterized protein (TIGR02466 family)